MNGPSGDTSDRQFVCKLCGSNFNNETSKELHEKYHHKAAAAVAAVSGSPGPASEPAAPERQPFPTEGGRPEWEPAPADSKNGHMARGEEHYYPQYWEQPGGPPPGPGPQHEQGPPETGGWSEGHFPPTPDSSGYGGHSSKSPNDDTSGAEILDLDSNRVHFYTPAAGGGWPPFYGGPPGLTGHPGLPAHLGHLHGHPGMPGHLPPSYGPGGPAPGQFNSTPPPPMIPPYHQQQQQQLQQQQQQQQHAHQQLQQHQQQQQGPQPGYGSPGLQVAMPPPSMFPGYGGPPSGPDSPGSDKTLGSGQPQQCKRPKTYLCEVCDKKFTSMGHLKRHFNTIVHRQTKEGKKSSPSVKSKSRSRAAFGDSAPPPPPAPVPPLVTMPSGPPEGMRMYGLPFPPASGPPPPQYPMTPPLQEGGAPGELGRRPAEPLGSPTPIVAPPPQPLGYPPAAPEYQVSVSAAPNPAPAGFLGAFSSAASYGGFGSYSAQQPVYSQAGLPLPSPQQQQSMAQQQQSMAQQHHQQLLGFGHHQQPQQPPQQQQQQPGQSPCQPQQQQEGGEENGDQSEDAPSPGSASGSVQSSEDSECTEEPYICCNKRFSSLQYYKLHRESQHSGERQTKCAQCCRRHRPEVSCAEYDRTHRRRHQCSICDKEFTHFSDLKRHRYTHQAEKPFICHVCGKGFIRKDQMEKHMPTHEGAPQPAASPHQQWSPHGAPPPAAFSGVANGSNMNGNMNGSISGGLNGAVNGNGHLMQPSF
ncbi:Zinc finger protein 628 [Amphibalanus amphitrite]|uniref:Zinc finger protein 628 n=1 Tax=Amphibalanus amphitrite TaxID=1232801 RepID=A0A6A4W0U4_AMPAM|nr:Zinc finger protein 628 [Amphibalanus amphitrite]